MTFRPTNPFAALALAAAIAFPAAAGAQEPVSEEKQEALLLYTALDVLNEDILTDEQQVTVALLANDVAVTSVCEGFAIDPAKFAAAFQTLYPAQWGEMEPAERVLFGEHLLVFYGMHVGAALAEKFEDPSGVCAVAEAERTNPNYQHVWAAPAE